ncbi:hypothetical protein [Burkholderia pyrrocinia]
MNRLVASALLLATSLLTSIGAFAIESDARPAPLMGVPVMTGLTRARLPDQRANPPTALDAYRSALKTLSPFAYEALQAVEARRGARYIDSEIPAVSRTPEFQAELNRAQQRFCENPQNASSLACHRWPLTAKNAVSTRTQDSDVLATARKTLSGNEEVIAPNN